MKYYTPDMFDINNLEEIMKDVFTQKETLEFQLGIYQDKFDTFKKLNYSEMLVYERKKENNPSLIPDKVVLQQIKEIEREPIVKSFRQTITKLKRDIKNIETEISNESTKINNLFSFKDKNVEIYLDQLNLYFNGGTSFELLMEQIFNNEFNNKNMYYEVAGLRNFDILDMLVLKAPQKWKDVMQMIVDEAMYVYKMEEIEIIKNKEIITEKGLNMSLFVDSFTSKYASILEDK